MLCGVVVDALLFLVVDCVCRPLEEDGLLQRLNIFFCYCSFRTGRTYIYYVNNVSEISAKEKEILFPKICWKIRYIFIVPCVQENVYESSTLLCSAFFRKKKSLKENDFQSSQDF